MTIEKTLQELIDAFGIERTHEMIDAIADAFMESFLENLRERQAARQTEAKSR